MKKHLFILSLTLLVSAKVFAQGVEVTGTVQEAKTKIAVVGASVLLINQQDSTQRKGVQADTVGFFKFTGVQPGNYRLRVTSIGYDDLNTKVTVGTTAKNLGTIVMGENAR